MGILQQQRSLLQQSHNPCGTPAPARPGAPRRLGPSLSHVQRGSAGSSAASAALATRGGVLRVGPPRRHRGPRPTEAHSDVPPAQGLFNPENDQDSCGVGFVGELSKQPSRRCVTDALKMLERMTHRGACGCEENTGKRK
ncbi:glutamate synthase [Raphidocelis subcapitata]|uniref:glutamate synthase (ferredoxin) n=1 Tax=Raphidocelis subcapitata TaxID=307507 RepID=A0A2V0PPU5_9CHLO|nr:glutamate synthase [Raphidocelis subcapitata]|eukprot:GBF99215.1 glutamate synthase [Raphidocelis subcapitata]